MSQAEAKDWLAEWAGAFEDWTLDIEEVFDAGDQIVTFVRQHAKARHGGANGDVLRASRRTQSRRAAGVVGASDHDPALTTPHISR
jgi:hypothetical protein